MQKSKIEPRLTPYKAYIQGLSLKKKKKRQYYDLSNL